MGLPSRKEIMELARYVQSCRRQRDTAASALKWMDERFSLGDFKPAYDSGTAPLRVILRALRSANPKVPRQPLGILPDAQPQEQAIPPVELARPERKTLPRVGVAEWNPTAEGLPEWAREAILAALMLPDDQANALLEEVDDAFMRAKHRTEWRSPRAEVKKALQAVQAAAQKLVDALETVPQAGQSFIRAGGIPFSQFHLQARAQLDTATRAAERAEKDLAGRGADKDNNPAILAAGIAAALRLVGIEPTTEKPTPTNPSAPYYQITQTCFKAAGLTYADPYRDMCAGLNVKVADIPDSSQLDSDDSK